MLDEEMLWALTDLPDQYDFAAYSHFFNVYGTHYITEGTMGGVLDYVAVVNKNEMIKQGKCRRHSPRYKTQRKKN